MDVALISTGFFEERLIFWKFRIPKRLLVPFLAVGAAKIAGAALVYRILNIQTSGTFWFNADHLFNWSQNNVLLENVNLAPKWSYPFVGWDSAWYLSIMTRGYGFSPNSFAFSPGLPLSARVLNLLVTNPVVSAAIVTFVFGVFWVPFFQLVTERYVGKQAALGLTVLCAFSPYVFLFTTVFYSEGMFFLFTLGAWYLLQKGEIAPASSAAAISVLARFVGVVLVLPMLVVSFLKKGVARATWIAFSVIPVGALLVWLIYSKLAAGDFLAFMHVTEWSSLYTARTLLFEGLPQKGFNALLLALQNTPTPPNWLSPFTVIATLIAPPFLMYLLAKKEKSLTLYCLLCYVWILLFGALASVPRYVSFLFPLWIPLGAKLSMSRKSIAFLVVVSVVCFIISLSLWLDFLNGQFVA